MKTLTKTSVLSFTLVVGMGIIHSSAMADEPLIQPSAEGQLVNQSAEADRLFIEGREASSKRQWAAAYEVLVKAFALKQSYDIAGNLAVAASELKRHPEAARYSWFALSQFPATGDAAKRAELTNVYSEAQGALAQVRLRTKKGAAITINGKPVSLLAEPDAPVFLPPGQIRVEASMPGHQPDTRIVPLKAGRTVYIELEPKPFGRSAPDKRGTADPATDTATTDQAGHSQASPLGRTGTHPSVIPIAVSGGAAVLGLGVGLGLQLVGNAAFRRADEAQAAQTDYACHSPSNADTCADIKQNFERSDNLRNAATVSFLVGGAAFAAAGVTGYLYYRDELRFRRESSLHTAVAPKPRWTAIPAASPQMVGLVMTGAF